MSTDNKIVASLSARSSLVSLSLCSPPFYHQPSKPTTADLPICIVPTILAEIMSRLWIEEVYTGHVQIEEDGCISFISLFFTLTPLSAANPSSH